MHNLYVHTLCSETGSLPMSSKINTGNGEGLSAVGLEDSCSLLDELMITAYGDKLLYCDGGSRHSVWCQHWSIIIQCMCQHYSLPGGSVGKNCIDLLCAELQCLPLGTYHSEQVINFYSVMLQWEGLVHKASDICHFLEGCMNLWCDEKLMSSFRNLFIVIGLFIIPIGTLYLKILKNTQLRCLQV